jgi:rhamnosyltransferase
MQISSEEVCAVVVSFNPDPVTLLRLIEELTRQVGELVVVDNGSRDASRLRDLCLPQASFLSLESNLGIAAAHNAGIAHARGAGARYVLLMDQDSIPAEDMVEHLRRALARLLDENSKVSAVGACYFGSHIDNESFFVRFGRLKFRRAYCSECPPGEPIQADFLISSGSLIPLNVLDDVGNMDESLFIDHVDTDWFLRASAAGYTAFGVCEALMQHGLGERTLRIWIGHMRNVPQHSPFRYYYIFRNSILLYRRPHAQGKWIFNDVLRLLFIAVLYVLFCPPRWQNLKMICRGIKDGFRGVTGATIIPGESREQSA